MKKYTEKWFKRYSKMNGSIIANRSSKDRLKTELYSTPDNVTRALLNFLDIDKSKTIWECACGDGSMSKTMSDMGYDVISSELNDYGYGLTEVDFFEADIESDWIITNPPFSGAAKFIERCIELNKPFALLFKSQFWHARNRFKLFDNFKPRYVLPLTFRPKFLFEGKLERLKNENKRDTPTMECLWTVWDKDPSITEYILLKK